MLIKKPNNENTCKLYLKLKKNSLLFSLFSNLDIAVDE